jgi:hypothetical protein
VIRIAQLEEITKDTLDYSERVLGTLPGIGRFLIEYGKQILVEPEAGVEEKMLSPSILGTAMSVLLQQRGLLVLHASSVAIDHQAIAFMGGAGWGKSTLAAAFHAKGFSVLTDDVMPIRIDQGRCTVIPAFPQFKLWHQTAEVLGHDPSHFPAIHPRSPKLSYTFVDGFQQNPLALKRIYVLAKGENHQIIPLPAQEAFVELVRHSRAVNVMTRSNAIATHTQRCFELVKQVSFCRFIRKPSLAELSNLVKLVEDDLEQLDTHSSALVVNN